jgi:hypothetical protein
MGDRWDGDTGGISKRPRHRWDGDVSGPPPASPGGGGRLLQQHPLLTDTIQHTASPASTAYSASTEPKPPTEPPDTPQTSIPFYNSKPPVTG